MNIRVLLFTCGFLSLSMGIAYPFFSEYVYAITDSAVTAGLVASVRGFVCIFSLFFGGHLADVIGRKGPLWAGTFLLGFSQLLYAFARSSESFFIAALFEGIAFFYFPAFTTMLMDSAARNQLMRVFTLALVAEHLPYTLSPVVGGMLRDSYGVMGLRIGFGFGAGAMLLVGALRFFLLTETLAEPLKFRAGMLKSAMVEVGGSFKKLSPFVAKLFFLRGLILLNGISMFYYFAVLYAVRYAGVVSFAGWGLIMALASASYLLALPLTGVVGRFGSATVYSTLIAVEASVPLMFLSHAMPLLFFAMAVLNVCAALTYALERSFVATLTEPTMRGKAEGFMNVSFYSGAAMGSLVGGWLFSLHPPLLLCMASGLLALGAWLGFMLFRGLPKLSQSFSNQVNEESVSRQSKMS